MQKNNSPTCFFFFLLYTLLMAKQTLSLKVITGSLEKLKNSYMYKNIGEFFEGVFAGFEQKEFDHNFSLNDIEFAHYPDYYDICRFNFLSSSSKDESMEISFFFLDEPTEYDDVLKIKNGRNVQHNTHIACDINKPIFYDGKKIGNMQIYSKVNQNKKLDYALGNTLGKQIGMLGTSCKDGLSKEVFDSVIMYLVTRYYSSKSKSKGKLDIRGQLGNNGIYPSDYTENDFDLSLNGFNYESFYYSSSNENVLRFGGGVEFPVTPQLLQNLKLGMLNKKSGLKK